MWNLSKVRLMKIAKDPPYVIEAKKKGKGKEKTHIGGNNNVWKSSTFLVWCGGYAQSLNNISECTHKHREQKQKMTS